MKILGEGEKGNYIVEISKNEIANLLGFYSLYSMRDSRDSNGILNREGNFVVGSEIEVSELYRDSEKLKEISKIIRDQYTLFKDMMAIMHKHQLSSKVLEE